MAGRRAGAGMGWGGLRASAGNGTRRTRSEVSGVVRPAGSAAPPRGWFIAKASGSLGPGTLFASVNWGDKRARRSGQCRQREAWGGGLSMGRSNGASDGGSDRRAREAAPAGRKEGAKKRGQRGPVKHAVEDCFAKASTLARVTSPTAALRPGQDGMLGNACGCMPGTRS